jgi:hypothetical protein
MTPSRRFGLAACFSGLLLAAACGEPGEVRQVPVGAPQPVVGPSVAATSTASDGASSHPTEVQALAEAASKPTPGEPTTADEWSAALPVLRPEILPEGTYGLGTVGTVDVSLSSDGATACLHADSDDGSATNICAGPREDPTGYLDMTTNIDFEDGSPIETLLLLDSSVDFSMGLVDRSGAESACPLAHIAVGPFTMWGCSYAEGPVALRYTAHMKDGTSLSVLLDTPGNEK